MITWSVIANIVHQRVAEPALDQLNRTEKAVSILKQLKKFGINLDPPPDFEGCYVHTLVEYGIHAKQKYGEIRCEPLIHFFAHQEISEAFQKWLEDPQQKRETFEKNAAEMILWDKVGEDLRHVKLENQIRQEFQVFADIFNQHVDHTRSVFQARIESKVDLIVADLEDLPQNVVAAIKKEIMSGLHQSRVVISDDGLPISNENRFTPPLKQFNPQYEEIYNGMDVPDDQQSPLQNSLRLAGLVKEKDGYLRISNEIYRHVFNRDWIEKKRIFIRTKRKTKRITSRTTGVIGNFPLSVPSH